MLSKSDYEEIIVKKVKGRYVTNDVVFDFLSELNDLFILDTIGHSVLGRPIKSVEVGNGSNRILMWSQMHGNESTTTKAVLDLLKLFDEWWRVGQYDSTEMYNQNNSDIKSRRGTSIYAHKCKRSGFKP